MLCPLIPDDDESFTWVDGAVTDSATGRSSRGMYLILISNAGIRGEAGYRAELDTIVRMIQDANCGGSMVPL